MLSLAETSDSVMDFDVYANKTQESWNWKPSLLKKKKN